MGFEARKGWLEDDPFLLGNDGSWSSQLANGCQGGDYSSRTSSHGCFRPFFSLFCFDHSLKLTIALDIALENRPKPKRKVVFQLPFVKCYVSFRECIFFAVKM